MRAFSPFHAIYSPRSSNDHSPMQCYLCGLSLCEILTASTRYESGRLFSHKWNINWYIVPCCFRECREAQNQGPSTSTPTAEDAPDGATTTLRYPLEPFVHVERSNDGRSSEDVSLDGIDNVCHSFLRFLAGFILVRYFSLHWWVFLALHKLENRSPLRYILL